MYEDDNKEVLDENELKGAFIMDDDLEEDDLLGSIRDEDEELLGIEEEEDFL
jgi:hypothetical protein